MRVLLISHTCQSKTEGQPKAHCLAAESRDIELRVLVPDRWKHYGGWRQPDIPTQAAFQLDAAQVRWPWVGPAQFYLHWYPHLAETLRTFRPDVIDLWEEPWGLVSAHACRLRNRLLPNARIVSETEQNLNKRLPFPFERFRSYTLRNADYAVARNMEAVSVLKSKGYEGPVEVVGNAVDTAVLRPLDRQQCRSELGLDSDVFIAGYVGRLVGEKGLTDLLEAFAILDPNMRLLFVGDGPLRTELQDRANTLSVAHRVKFLPARPLNELVPVINALNVLVLPSRTTPRWKEQFGRVIIEAHACGVPVVGSNSGAIQDVVGAGGLIFQERDVSALAQVLRLIAADPVGAVAMGEAGRLQVAKNYTWQRVAEKMAAIYRRVTDAPPRRMLRAKGTS